VNAPSHISWLRLERLHLGELSEVEQGPVQAHVDGCPVCQEALSGIRADARRLPALPVALPVPSATPWWRRAWLPALAMAAAAMVVVAIPTEPETAGEVERVVERVSYKGGELAIALVREDGSRAGVYRDGDRFQVRLTCPPGEREWAVVVSQEGEEVRPLVNAGPLSCGNEVVAGTFAITGPGEAVVCATVDALSLDEAVCVRLRPAE